MWFVKDLTEFANEARNMLTGEPSGQPEDGGDGTTTSRGAAPQPQRRKAGGDEEATMKNTLLTREGGEEEDGGADEDKMVLVGYDANGVPLFESANSEIGAQYVEAQKLVNEQVAAEEKAENEEEGEEEESDNESNYSDEDDDNQPGGSGSRKSLLAVIRRLKDELKAVNDDVDTKANNIQRLQSIVTAQQRKIKTLEDQLLLQAQQQQHQERLPREADLSAQNLNEDTKVSPQKQVVEPLTSSPLAPQDSKGTSLSKLPPPPPSLTSAPVPHPSTSTDSSITGVGLNTSNATPARAATTGSSGYESWEDVGQNSKQQRAQQPAQHVDPKPPTTNTSADDEDWANFV